MSKEFLVDANVDNEKIVLQHMLEGTKALAASLKTTLESIKYIQDCIELLNNNMENLEIRVMRLEENERTRNN